MSAKTYVITGANTGVGKATAEALARSGARILLACRNPQAAERTREELAAQFSDARVETVALDLASLRSVLNASAEIAARVETIDALINNAGVGGARGRTEDGFELAFGTNYLGHYLLTRKLLSSVPIGRVVHAGSGSHERAETLDFASLQRATRTLTGVREYAQSKLCVMLFNHTLRHEGVASVVADPGNVASDGYRHVPQPFRWWMMRGMQTPEDGAKTGVHCATAPSGTSSPLYCGLKRREPSRLAEDRALAEKLERYTKNALKSLF